MLAQTLPLKHSGPPKGSCLLQRSPQRRRGFTLVELLVVITIIGILMSLLLPAVQQIRAAARQLQCKNHLKQLSLGLLNSETTFKSFPSAGWGNGWAPHPARGSGRAQPGGWGYAILPFIEQQAVYDLGNTVQRNDENSNDLQNSNVQRLAFPIPVYHCPSRRSPEVLPFNSTAGQPRLCGNIEESARTDYAINGGHTFIQFGQGPQSLQDGDQDQGFPNSAGTTGIVFVRSRVKMSAIKDGSSNTYMVGEKYLNPDNYDGGQNEGDDQGPYVSDDKDMIRYGYVAPQADRPGVILDVGFGSSHFSNMNMAFCDGSVRTIPYGIEPLVHQNLSNRRDGQVVSLEE